MASFSVGCPVCNDSPKAFRGFEDYNSRVAYDCPRCGRFRLGKMAYFELENRISCGPQNFLASLKLRQLIKKRGKFENWPLISREEITEVADDPSMRLQVHEVAVA